MKAAVLGTAGIEVREVAIPSLKPSEVLVRTGAASLNRADLLIAAGMAHGFASKPGMILGGECAGVVDAVGSEVVDLKIGDRVAGSAAGAFSEYVAMDSGRAYKLSGTMLSYEKATCFPYAVQMMHDAIVGVGRLQRGESVLIQGASSGVGLLGMQIAKLKGASIVLGTSSNDERRLRLKEFGCDLAIDPRVGTWPDEVRAATGNKGVDLIVDQVSAGMANANMQAAAVRARIINVGRLGGMEGTFDYDLHALKRINYIGVTFRTRSVDEYRAIVRAATEDLWADVEAGVLVMPIDRVFALDDVAAAFDHMRANAHLGKIVLKV